MTRAQAATVGLLAPAAMALGMSADTSYRFLGTALGVTGHWERGLLCGVAEAAIVALTVYAWATTTKGPAYLAYAAVLVQAVPAFAVSGGIGGPVRVALGPVLLAVMLHLLLGLEVRMSGVRPDSLLRATVRELRERATAWLGIGRRGTDSAAIARSRAADRAVALADLVAAAGLDTRRYRRRAARLATAIDSARHGLDHVDATAAEAVIVGRIVRRKSVGDLAAIGLRHDWTAFGVATPEPATVLVERADRPTAIKVPEPVPHLALDKGFKRPLPALPAPPAEPAPELTAVDFLARTHKVRPEQIRTVAELLAVQPALSGKAVGVAIGTGDRYGRRVLTAAKELTS